jgi:hypothetical protein
MKFISIVSGPDTKERYTLDVTWIDENRTYCATCGKAKELNCACFDDNYTSGQIQHTKLSSDIYLTPLNKGE